MQRSFISLVALLGMGASVAMPVASSAMDVSDLNKAVLDARGNTVTSTFGNCVVHLRWEAGRIGDCVAERTEQVSVYFDFNRSGLNAEAVATLNAFAAKVAGHTVTSATVVGTADVIGDAAANRALSQKRAKRVSSYLKGKGILNARVAQLAAKGESEPTTDCGAESGKATSDKIACLQNDRRVDVVVTYK